MSASVVFDLILGWSAVAICLAALLALAAQLSRHIRAHINERPMPPMQPTATRLGWAALILVPIALWSLQ